VSISPLAPVSFPELPPVGGVQLATYAAGLKYHDRADLMLAVVPPRTTVAGTLTKSMCPSAPVDWCRSLLTTGAGRAIVCNAGNANAFTGTAGATVAATTASVIAEALGVDDREVYLASTGVIGESLPEQAMAEALPQLALGLTGSGAHAWEAAANAIRTTDTFAKGSSASVGDSAAVVVGIAKGSGMIAPDMATMLAFVFTDAVLDSSALQAATSRAVESSFNRITVDSDTSTSDTVLVFSTGTAGEVDSHAFGLALDAVMLDLAHQIIRDGEGATKFVEVRVQGAVSDESAKTIALSIANSPLVKTALAAEDANWGRVVAAVGKAGQPADRDALQIWIGEELTAESGVQASGYSEAAATEHLQQDEVCITVDVGVGDGQASVWTCDLTHGYIDINAGYRS
jgi:glutamate N-acetyltransferase / amino-acid N-acetyltransferase